MAPLKKYLVTGGTGFIGAALVRRLVLLGFEVRVLDNNIRGSLERLSDLRGDFELVDADIRDAESVAAAIKGMDGVFHLAFINGTEFFYSQPELVLDVGVRGMINIIDGCKKYGVGELVLASSSEVYQTPLNVPTSEGVRLSVPDPVNPRYSYGGGKIISEMMAINYGRSAFDRVQIFRPHNVYGPNMGWEHVLPQLVLRMKGLAAQQPDGRIEFAIQGTGNETRSFVFIDDFIDGVMMMSERGEHLEIYHIGTDEERRISDVAYMIAEYFDRQIEIKPGPSPTGQTLRRCPDISKLGALGYFPRVSLREGLTKLAVWYDEHADLAPQYGRTL